MANITVSTDRRDLQNQGGAPTAGGLAARLAVRHLERVGVDPKPLLLKSGLSDAVIAEQKRVSVSSQILLLELASRAANDEWIGLTLAAECELRELGMLYYVAASSHELGDAFRRLSRYVRLANEALVVKISDRPLFSIQAPTLECNDTKTGTRLNF